MVRCLRPLLILLVLATTVRAEASREDYVQVLFPFAFGGEVRGAFGSRWVVDSWGRNDADQFVKVSPTPWADCGLPGCVELAGAKTTFSGPRLEPAELIPPGAFLYVERSHADEVHFSMRVRDVSREEISYGAGIPVVREEEFRAGRIVLLDVPSDPRYRVSVRVYTNDVSLDGSVRVRVLPLESEQTLIDLPLTWSRPVQPHPQFPAWANSAEIHHLLALVPGLNGDGPLRIEIESDLQIWAFATVTNELTQQLTVITPN